MYHAHEKALEVARKHASEERVANLENLCGPSIPNTRQPEFLASFQAELIAWLSEICEDQDRRIGELEKAAAAKSTARKK